MNARRYDYEGRGAFSEPSGPRALGHGALYRWYATADGHVFVAANDSPALRASLARNAGIDLRAVATDGACVATMERRLAAWPTATALETLGGVAGLSAVPLSTLAQLRERNPSAQTSFRLGGGTRRTFHFNTTPDHPIGGPVTMLAPSSLLSRRVAVSVPTASPQFGQHSRSVLREILGFSDAEIAALKDRGAVGDTWSKAYIPTGDPWADVQTEYGEYLEHVKSVAVAASATTATSKL